MKVLLAQMKCTHYMILKHVYGNIIGKYVEVL